MPRPLLLLSILVIVASCVPAEDIERGRRVYQAQCAGCHGPTGAGARGADLTRGLSRAPDQRALVNLVRRGVPGTEMPGFGPDMVADDELLDLAAFVRALKREGSEKASGSAARGQQLFRTRGKCLQCHTVGAEGGLLGPDLTNVGARRGAAFLRTALLDPDAY